jgi:tight adherence protein B
MTTTVTPLLLIAVFLVGQSLVYLLAWSLWRMSRRLSVGRGSKSSIEKPGILLDTRLSVFSRLDRILKLLPLVQPLKRWLVQAGLSIKVDLFLLIVLASVSLSGIVTAALFATTAAIGTAMVLGGLAPFMVLGYARRRRQLAFQEQLPYALDALARTMQAGHSFTVALRMVSRDLEDPMASEFRLAAEEINFGASVRVGMERLADRINTSDIRFFVAAVLIHMQTGGRLTELLFNLAVLVRERRKLVKTIRVLSAEGRLAAWILTALPVVTGFAIYTLNPGYISMLWTDPNGVFLIKVMAVMAAIGLLWMAWLTRTDVS